ncbi:MAG: translation elongation factor Ts [Verrucomicrobium sp.]|nr:translation elongation factor Ts [Verrucomicrobium sp.]
MSAVEIAPELVKKLRDQTGAGMMDCKKALLETKGDLEAAEVWLRKKGSAGAAKKAGREAKDGVIGSYIHAGEKVGVLIEINCETDFVARTPAFRELVKDLTLQVAAASPRYVSREEVPQAEIDKEKEVAAETVKGKPENVVEKIVSGKLDKYFATVCLLEQGFIKDPNVVVRDLIAAKIAELGENIVVRRFSRFQLGESL